MRNVMTAFYRSILMFFALLAASTPVRAGIVDELLDPDAAYTGPSVEERIVLMDEDKNGFCDVHEIRQFLEKTHGKDYKQELLARLEANAIPQSCGASVAETFLIE